MDDDPSVEIRLGLYATDKAAAALSAACGRVLAARGVEHRVSVLGAGESTGVGGGPIGVFHEDLVEQWRLTHPGADPGARAVWEIRVALGPAAGGVEEVRAELVRIICPDPGHRSPCEVPWASYTVASTG